MLFFATTAPSAEADLDDVTGEEVADDRVLAVGRRIDRCPAHALQRVVAQQLAGVRIDEHEALAGADQQLAVGRRIHDQHHRNGRVLAEVSEVRQLPVLGEVVLHDAPAGLRDEDHARVVVGQHRAGDSEKTEQAAVGFGPVFPEQLALAAVTEHVAVADHVTARQQAEFRRHRRMAGRLAHHVFAELEAAVLAEGHAAQFPVGECAHRFLHAVRADLRDRWREL